MAHPATRQTASHQPQIRTPDKPHKRERQDGHTHSTDSKVHFFRHSREAITRIRAVDQG
jgi:hypothetical protein